MSISATIVTHLTKMCRFIGSLFCLHELCTARSTPLPQSLVPFCQPPPRTLSVIAASSQPSMPRVHAKGALQCRCGGAARPVTMSGDGCTHYIHWLYSASLQLTEAPPLQLLEAPLQLFSCDLLVGGENPATKQDQIVRNITCFETSRLVGTRRTLSGRCRAAADRRVGAGSCSVVSTPSSLHSSFAASVAAARWCDGFSHGVRGEEEACGNVRRRLPRASPGVSVVQEEPPPQRAMCGAGAERSEWPCSGGPHRCRAGAARSGAGSARRSRMSA